MIAYLRRNATLLTAGSVIGCLADNFWAALIAIVLVAVAYVIERESYP